MSYCKYCGAWQIYVTKADPCKDCGKQQTDPTEIAWYCSLCGKFEYLGTDKDICAECERKQQQQESGG